MDQKEIIEKIKKLLEINRANRATEAEEMNAYSKANDLMEKYQIEEFQLKRGFKSKCVRQSDVLNDKSEAFTQLRASIAEFFGVLCLSTTIEYSYYGQPDQVELALTMTKRALSSLSLGYTAYLCTEEYRQNRRRASRRDVRLSFRDGFCEILGFRLQKLIFERQKRTKAATGTDLVVLNEQNLDNAFKDDFGYIPLKGRRRQRRLPDRAAFEAGAKEGQQFRIAEEIKNNGNDQRTN